MYLVFGKEGCEPCRKAKEAVEQKGGTYITCTPEMQQKFKEEGFKTFPIVYKFIGGYAEMAEDDKVSVTTFAGFIL